MHGFFSVQIPSLSRVPLRRVHPGHRILSPLNGWGQPAEPPRTPTSGDNPTFVPLSKFMNVSRSSVFPPLRWSTRLFLYLVTSCATRRSTLETLVWELPLRTSQLSLTRALPISGCRPRDVISSVCPAVSSPEEEGPKGDGRRGAWPQDLRGCPHRC